MKKVIFILSFPLIILNFHLGLSQEKRIISEGRSTLTNLDIEKARDRAVERALREAVEQGVGVHISSQSLTENYRLIYDIILSKSTGYVQQYKIISEGSQDGYYIVKISALVKIGNIKDDLLAIGILLERKNLPRVMVLVNEQLWSHTAPGDINRYFSQHQSQVEACLAAILLQKGFYVLDSEAIKQNKEKEQAIRALQGNNRAAKLLGHMMNADVVLIGEAHSNKNGVIAGSNLISVTTSLTLKAVRVDTGEILAANTWNSSGAGLNALGAANNSAKRISDTAGNILISDVLEKYKSETGSTHIIQLIVNNITDFSHLDFLEKSLVDNRKGIPGIKQLYRRSFEKGIAIIDAKIKGESESIATAIQAKKFRRFKVLVTGASKEVIKLTIVQSKKNIK